MNFKDQPRTENEDTFDLERRDSDVIEFGGDENSEYDGIRFEVCKGLICPLD